MLSNLYPKFQGFLSIIDENGVVIHANERMRKRMSLRGLDRVIGRPSEEVISGLPEASRAIVQACADVNIQFSELEESTVATLQPTEDLHLPTYHLVKFKHVVDDHIATFIAGAPASEGSSNEFIEHIKSTLANITPPVEELDVVVSV